MSSASTLCHVAEDDTNSPLLGDVCLHDDEEELESTEKEEPQKMTKKKKIAVCAGSFIFSLFVILLLTYLVIIPTVMQDVTDDEEISMSVATISNPTEDSFDVSSTMTFSKKPPLPATAKMHDTDLSWEGLPLAVMTHINKLDVDTPPQTLQSSVLISDVEVMSDFNIFLMGASSFDWHIHGHADAIAVGDKVDITVDKDISMKGFDGFPVSPIIETVSVYEGTPEYLYSLSTTLLFSPANIAFVFGQDVHFQFKSNGVQVGVGTIYNASFLPGEFAVNATIAMTYGTALQTAEMSNVCGRYISQLPTNVTMENFYLSSPVAWLTPALAGLHFESVLPPVNEGVIDSLDMFVYLGDILNVQWGGHFYNPLDTFLTMYTMKCDVVYEEAVIGKVNEKDIEITIPPKSHIISDNDMHARTVLENSEETMALLKAGSGLLMLDCQISTAIDYFMVDLHYVQADVPVTIHKGRPDGQSNLL